MNFREVHIPIQGIVLGAAPQELEIYRVKISKIPENFNLKMALN